MTTAEHVLPMAPPLDGPAFQLREGTPHDAAGIFGLIEANLEAGHLLPRRLAEIEVHAGRFLVSLEGDRVIGCVELAPLSPELAEVRSFVVQDRYRGNGVGSKLLAATIRRAVAGGFGRLCVFTHDPAPFLRSGFSLVPHVWLPEKIALDCHACAQFRRCRQHALLLSLSGSRRAPERRLA